MHNLSFGIVSSKQIRTFSLPVTHRSPLERIILESPLTRCADGKLAKECHAVELDTRALGWSDEQRAKFEASFGAGKALAVSGLVDIGASSGTTNLTLTGATGSFTVNNGGGAGRTTLEGWFFKPTTLFPIMVAAKGENRGGGHF